MVSKLQNLGAALRVSSKNGIRVSGFDSKDVLGGKPVMNIAISVMPDDPPVHLCSDILSQVLIRDHDEGICF